MMSHQHRQNRIKCGRFHVICGFSDTCYSCGLYNNFRLTSLIVSQLPAFFR
uniref:Uncharacterized protein n=1 Tax=Anguilla anguilla TaxID=7936 RepID=A0A0E9WX29_ANGAN